MTKASDNQFPSVLFTEQASKPASPSAGDRRLYFKDDHKLYHVDSAGAEAEVGGGGTGDVTWAIIQAAQLANEVMNFPSLEGANDAQPEWWEEGDAHATLTEVDVAGEGITETYARAHKVVTDGDGAYSYQRYTYADQPRIKSGRKLSAIFAVWSVGGKAARIRLQSSVGSLGVSSDTTTAGWTILKVEGVTLNGTYVDIRCECDTGTAYFVPLGINIGEKAVPLRPRGLKFRSCMPVLVVDLTGSGPTEFADLDVSANTSNLAVLAELMGVLRHIISSQTYAICVRQNGASQTDPNLLSIVISYGNRAIGTRSCFLDDQQIFEWQLVRMEGTANLASGMLNLIGWWEWE